MCHYPRQDSNQRGRIEKNSSKNQSDVQTDAIASIDLAAMLAGKSPEEVAEILAMARRMANASSTAALDEPGR
jgi:hypothetical protein